MAISEINLHNHEIEPQIESSSSIQSTTPRYGETSQPTRVASTLNEYAEAVDDSFGQSIYM